MSDHRCGGGAKSRLMAGAARNGGVARGLAVSMLVAAGVGGCSSSPAYPTRLGEQPGDSSVIAVQPRYPASARDAAQDAADRASQQGGGQPGYPAYGAAPAAPPQAAVYGAPPAAPPPPADEADDDAPHPIPHSSVDSSDLPPPAPTAPPAAAPNEGPPPGQPQAISYGGGQIVFGTDRLGPAPLEFAAYRHRRHRAEPAPAAADAADASDGKAAAPGSTSRRHGRAAESEVAGGAPGATAIADTPYQTIVRPGEKLAQVAERVHSSPGALSALNDLKHPRHVKAGTVLKIPYRYSYEVQKGDTLYTIAHRFDQDPQAIAKLNGLKAVPTLQPGQSIDLPPTAEDTGKRDHAAAAAPSPVAAPEKLAAAALRKAERHGRRRRGEAAAVETASADAASPMPPASEETPRSRRARRRQETALAAAEPPMASPPPTAAAAAAEVRADAAEDAGRPSPRPSTAAVSSQAAAPPATAYAGVRPTAPVTGAVAGYGYRPAETPPAPAAGYRTAAAPQPAYRAPVPVPVPTYRAAAPAPSTFAAPTYAARAPAIASEDTPRVASLTPPRYTPSYPAGGFSPSLGRERPIAPALSAGALTPTEIAAAGRGRFVWPLRGQLISGFGDKGAGQHNDGVDIAAISGAGVHAAAAGEVVYAGSSIPGFGNLVLVKHSGGWVTAYAHLDRIEVRMRDSVSQGEEIGLAGQTGAVDRPQLHFEVRYAPDPADKARPVDPALVLPGG